MQMVTMTRRFLLPDCDGDLPDATWNAVALDVVVAHVHRVRPAFAKRDEYRVYAEEFGPHRLLHWHRLATLREARQFVAEMINGVTYHLTDDGRRFVESNGWTVAAGASVDPVCAVNREAEYAGLVGTVVVDRDGTRLVAGRTTLVPRFKSGERVRLLPVGPVAS
jgi:hypothetical protein